MNPKAKVPILFSCTFFLNGSKHFFNDFYHFQDYFLLNMLYTHCYYVIKVHMGAIWLLGIIGALTEETSIEFLVKAITDSIES